MRLCESYQSVYDMSQVQVIDGEWVVHEREPNAIFRTLKIESIHEPSFALANSEYKCTHAKIFEKSSTLKDLDCDGFAVVTHEGKKYVVAVELKSSFDTKKVLQAYEQSVFSFLKNHMIFSLCQGYSVEDYDILIVIGCCLPNGDQKVWLKDQMMLIMNGVKSVHRDVYFAVKLFYEKSASCPMGSSHFLENLELPDSIKNRRMRIVLKCPSLSCEQELSLTFKDLLS